ncbi:hypothetical protein N9U40_01645 [Candidatus Pelagibacter sp.]|jgi:hypothetical protein|nr:hypothetical protein [Candidatus Pelagibacter sp.]|tara:strand:+ start:224 stop:772 length:549 start_codon:yes stop_codon:yes gene_type:complete
MKKIILITFIFLFSIHANAACKFDLDFGEDISKIQDKYGPAMPLENFGEDELSMVIAVADEVCPNHRLKDVAIEYRFLNDKLAAVNLISLNTESDTKKSEKLTIMKYVKRNYGDFDTGQTPTSYLGYEVFEKTKQFIVYQRILDDLGFIEEQMYLSNKKYDELLGIFYNQLEEEMAKSESQN